MAQGISATRRVTLRTAPTFTAETCRPAQLCFGGFLAIELVPVRDDLISMVLCHLRLQVLHFSRGELSDLAGINVNQVVVMGALGQLIACGASVKYMRPKNTFFTQHGKGAVGRSLADTGLMCARG